MAKGGEVVFDFKGNDKDLQKTTKSATSTLKSMSKIVAGLGITKMASDFLKTGISFNAEIEKYQTALTTLVGSTEKANKIIENIKKDASKTPFDVKGLTQANQLLISTGLEADDARKTILALGNAVSATGGGSDELSRMAVNLQQIKNLGKATSVDIKQFAMAGIDIYGMLSDYLGITRQQASEMEVSWDNLNGALIKASQEGGKYFGAMEKQSKTLNGQWSTLKDNFKEFAGEALLPITNMLKNDILPALNDIITGGEKIRNFISEHQNLLIILTGVIGTLTTAIVANTIATNLDLIVIWAYVTATSAATAVSTAFGAVLAFLTSPITLVVLAIGTLITVGVLLYKNWDKVKEKTIEIWTKIKEFLGNAIENIKNWFENLPDTIAYSLGKLLGKMIIFGLKAINWTKTEVPKIKNNIVNYFKQLPSNIWNALVSAINRFTTFLRNMKTKAKEGTRQVVDNIKNGFLNLPQKLKNIGWDIVEGLWNGIKNAGGWIRDKVSNFARGILDGMKDALGIQSPSKLFRDVVGKNVALGIGVGFEDEMGTVSKMMNKSLLNLGFGDMFELSPSLNNTSTSSSNVNVTIHNNMETDFMGNLVNNIKTYSNGSKNDYNYGMAY